jgi:hypothetical protein
MAPVGAFPCHHPPSGEASISITSPAQRVNSSSNRATYEYKAGHLEPTYLVAPGCERAMELQGAVRSLAGCAEIKKKERTHKEVKEAEKKQGNGLLEIFGSIKA